ncbi:selenocysteine-specific translation elongation factor [Candidatus Litorirhabdus singularis]|uniref:selenocysteine-specific translation elongation factor n=1 Tax=Candidatus Litorirhabdus singularis TaxID=2518993 RepID=UPI00242C4782|nr:selenocysteine-specific translation elongation factor [Candidatus Litorirhabdus singularis]
MIVATAGHVDHGKTSLIKHLTGVDTDRLEEEKRRGLSINLGYAYRKVAGCSPIGFVDVPGHTRFINTMIAGVNGIDLGLLVVAADDGIMPQTREHLDVLRLLGVDDYVLVITKIDRVEPQRVAEVSKAARALLHSENLSVFPVSNTAGTGISELLEHLEKRAQACVQRSREGLFRLSVDRVFTLKGTGLVVTGTATAGSVAVGETLRLLPADKLLRVRSLHVQDEVAEIAGAGERCALNLVGDVDKNDIERGDWLVAPSAAPPTQRFDARVELLVSAPFALRHLLPVKLHLGAKRIAARIYLLEEGVSRLQPGQSQRVQLILDQPACCSHGDRFLLRDDSESITLGGGTVLDPHAPQRGKSAPERQRWLQALEAESAAQALHSLVLEQNRLVDLGQFAQSWNLGPAEQAALTTEMMQSLSVERTDYVVSRSRWQAAEQRLQAFLETWHQQQPGQGGIPARQLEATLATEIEPALLQALLAAGLAASSLQLRDGLIGLSALQSTQASAADERWQQYQQLLQQRGKDIPLLSEVMTATGWDKKRAETVARNATRAGQLHQLTESRFAEPALLTKLAAMITAISESGEAITVVAFKTRMGTGRKIAIEVLEYFDRVGFTARRDNERVVVDTDLPARLFKG